MSWYLYILHCADGTYYAGITTDLERRTNEHNSSKRGAKYTRARRPVSLIAAWEFDGRSAASVAEHAFKRLARGAKERLLAGDSELADALGLVHPVRI